VSWVPRQGNIPDFACLTIYYIARSPELFVCLTIYENAETLSPSSSSSEHTTPAHTAASSLHLVFFQGSASRLSFIFLRDYVTFLTKKSVLGYADPSRKVTRLWILKQSTGQGKDHGRAGQLAFISKGTHKSNGHLLKMYALQKKKAISNFALKNGLDDWNSDDFDDAKTFKY